jgi:hypothetical protein
MLRLEMHSGMRQAFRIDEEIPTDNEKSFRYLQTTLETERRKTLR